MFFWHPTKRGKYKKRIRDWSPKFVKCQSYWMMSWGIINSISQWIHVSKLQYFNEYPQELSPPSIFQWISNLGKAFKRIRFCKTYNLFGIRLYLLEAEHHSATTQLQLLIFGIFPCRCCRCSDAAINYLTIAHPRVCAMSMLPMAQRWFHSSLLNFSLDSLMS